MLATDRDMANAGNPSFIIANPTGLTQAQLAEARITPTPAGANYPFGAP